MRKHLLVLLLLISNSFILSAQGEPPWERDPNSNSIITNGIVAVTCGETFTNAQDKRYTFGLMKIDQVLPDVGRVDVSFDPDLKKYHHPSWHIDHIGNVFGIAMDHIGNTFLTASANYSSQIFQNMSVIKYGTLAGGEESLASAGAIYQIDGQTGLAEHFTSLPQQETAVTNWSVESHQQIFRQTGPGLGNITFHRDNQEFYVTNFEDGRIYRLSYAGAIIDSYDPLTYDDGNPGISDLVNTPYGITISPNKEKLFFGTVGKKTLTEPTIHARIYSIPINPDGSFIGTVDNTNRPADATWNNYIGSELLHYEVSDLEKHFAQVSYSVADLEFLPSNELMVGVRINFGDIFLSPPQLTENAWLFTTYQHGGESFILEDVDGQYNRVVGKIHASHAPNGYGGVSYYQDEPGETKYVISGSDMLSSDGRDGIHISLEGIFGSMNNPVTPASIIAFSAVTTGFDPRNKGIGGDVYVYKSPICSCNGDANGDCRVDGDDFLIWQATYGTNDTDLNWNPSADMNEDGRVDGIDFLIWQKNFGSCEPIVSREIRIEPKPPVRSTQPEKPIDAVTSGDTSIKIMRSFFTPNEGSQAEIQVNLSQAAHVTTRIMHLRTRKPVRILYHSFGPGSHFIRWNGDNDLGQKETSGLYTASIVVTSLDGNVAKYDANFIMAK